MALAKGYPGGPGKSSTWKVVHTRVIIRKTPSTTASIMGFHAQGKTVEGVVQEIAGQPWLRIPHPGPDGKESDGYMLIDGTSVGLGRLLERVQGASAEPKVRVQNPVPAPKQKSRAKPNLGDLSKWIRHATAPTSRFEVVVNMVMVRNLPSTQADAVGVVKKGEILEGQPREGWLLLQEKSPMSHEALEQGEGRWILLDGKELGLGLLLRPQIPAPKVTKAFATSVQLSFPTDMSKYDLEVECEIGESFCTPCSQGKSMLVHGLHPCSDVRLRFVCRDKDGAAGEWEVVETTDVPDWEEADGPCIDLLGNKRGSCQQCPCKCFALEENVVSLNMDVGDARCARCGCNVAAHALWQEKKVLPKTSESPSPTSKQKPPKQAEAKPVPAPVESAIDKAIALPKETMLRRWRRLDVNPSEAWPRLQKEFSEVVVWSDLHSDMGKNMTHLKQLPICQDTVLLLAGDIASSLEVIETSFRLLQAKFGAIFYVPGNHELWVSKKDGLSSVHKFLAILEICEELGVHTRPAFINSDCAVCPLFSWYKDNLVDGFSRNLADIPFDMQTQWPWDITGRGDTNDAQQPEIADFFLSLNQRRIAAAPSAALDALKRAEVVAQEAKQAQLDGRVLPPLPKTKDDDEIFVVTMSHFVPRQECYPGPRRLCGVMGCREIEEQARACGSRCHVFGHSHISCDRQVEGVRYVQHPLGYPNDYHRQGEPKPVWGGCKSRQEAPSLTEEPASKLAKDIVKAIIDDIRDCPEKCLERPPGRWNKEDGDNYSSHNIFDRKEEMKLRESMGYDAKKMAELWSAPPPVRELEVEVTHFQHGDQRLTLNLPNNLLVRQLKERLVEEVGRGNPAKIVVSTSGENALNDDVALSSIESEISGGLIVMGIDMSKGKSVTVKLVHAASDIPQSLTISVLDTATMLDVRKEAMIRLGETSISNCKLVKRLATGGFQGLADGDRLNAKRELLFLGRDLPDSPSAQETKTKKPPPKEKEKVTARKGTAKAKADVSVPEVPTAQTAKRQPKSEPPGERLGRDSPPREMHVKITSLLDPDQQLEMGVASDFLVRELKELIVAELGHGDPSKILLSSTGDDVLRDERPLGTYEREVSGGLVLIGMDLKRPQESKPKEIKVKLVHATEAEQSLVLFVPEKSTILQLRKEVMQRVGEKSLANAKIVRRSGGGFVSFSDTEKLEGPRELLFLGCSLPSSPSTKETKESKELSLKQLLTLLEDIHDAVEKEPFQKNVLRMKAEFHSDMGKAKALLGPVFAAACADPLRKQGISLSKKGFDAMFAQIWQNRGQPGIVAATAEIEGLLGLRPGQWFGIEQAK
mmetsp:Transcript_42728/g.99681  ORF Transcript_42728/g.99681 Transcript_42728/m.99681 type:complete len:1322 (+) Transcript_42728:19-3984(+)